MDKIDSFDLINREPINFNGLLIYKPKLSEIEQIGRTDFSKRTNILTMSELDIRDVCEEMGFNLDEMDPTFFNPFNYLMLQCENKLFFLEVKLGFFTYIKKDIRIVDEHLQCKLDDGKIFIFDKNNFSDFQKIIKKINFDDRDEEFPEIISDNEVMKKKFEEKRKLLIETKRKERKKAVAKGDTIGLGEVISSICGYGIGYNLLNIWDLTIYQLYEQFQRCQLKENYDKNLSMIMAGADSKKIDLVYWIKKINNN